MKTLTKRPQGEIILNCHTEHFKPSLFRFHAYIVLDKRKTSSIIISYEGASDDRTDVRPRAAPTVDRRPDRNGAEGRDHEDRGARHHRTDQRPAARRLRGLRRGDSDRDPQGLRIGSSAIED